jgi:hypothetical protein
MHDPLFCASVLILWCQGSMQQVMLTAFSTHNGLRCLTSLKVQHMLCFTPAAHQVWEELLLLHWLLVPHRRCRLKHHLQQRINCPESAARAAVSQMMLHYVNVHCEYPSGVEIVGYPSPTPTLQLLRE